MAIFVLEDMGETEAAEVLIGGLLESGQISDLTNCGFSLRTAGYAQGTGPIAGK